MTVKSRLLAAYAPIFTLFITTNIASAAVLAGWDVNGVDLDGASAPNSPPYTLGATLFPTVASANLTLSPTVNSSIAANTYGFRIPTVSAQNSLAGAIAAGHYFEFTITAASGFLLNLTSIEMIAQSTATGADSAAFMSSIAGFTAGNELASTTGKAGVTGGFDTDASGFGAPIDLTGAAYQGISAVTFRFYGWDTTGDTGATSIRNLTGNDLVINGDTITAPPAIPEPSAALVGSIGVLLLFRRRYR